MAGVVVDITFDRTGAATAFAGLQAMGADLRPLLEDVGLELETSAVERFDTNVAPDGVAWPPSIRVREKGGRTLVETARLRDSIHYRVEDDAVEVGSNVLYAGVHQVGATITAKGEALHFQLATGAHVTVQSVKIPARPFLGISPADDVAIVEIAGEHYRAALGGGAS